MRYLPLSKQDRKDMLQSIGVDTIDRCYGAVPQDAFHSALDLPNHLGEREVEQELTAYAAKNRAARNGSFFLGAGCYFHHIPASVDHLIQRSEFLTSYTPYQPEIAQGTLTAIFEFQTAIARLTGMDVANASMYDGASATAEAALMAMRVTRKRAIHIHGELHPHYEETLKTYLRNYEGVTVSHDMPHDASACVIVQTPDFHGNVHALKELRDMCDKTGALLVVIVNEILALGLLPAPVEADIVAGEAQSIGVAMSFGGPHLGFFACKQKYLRQMPGRLCGETVDADGRTSYVLTLNTREQHIRREKATSNICTNQGLCALAFTIHVSLLGEDGFKHLARLNHERACELSAMLASIDGVHVRNTSFFNEFVVELPKDSTDVCKQLAAKNIVAGHPLTGNQLLVAVTEMATEDDMKALIEGLREVL